MKHLLIVLWILGMPIFALCQPSIVWQQTFGGTGYDQGRDIAITSDGGFAFLGHTESNNGDIDVFHGVVDYWVATFNVLGELKWSHTYGGSSHDWPVDFASTLEGGFVVVGYTSSVDGDVTGFHGEKDGWVIKIDQLGNIEWQKAIGGSGWDEIWCVNQTTDGGYIVGGRTTSIDGDLAGLSPKGYLDFWILKLSSTGQIEWQKRLGGSYEETVRAIKQTYDGGFIAVGYTLSNNGDVSGNHGNSDIWLVKLRSNGEVDWAKTFGGSYAETAHDIEETEDAFFMCGVAGSVDGDLTLNQGSGDAWILKTDKSGNILWQTTIGGSVSDYAFDGFPTPDGGYIFTGATKSNDGDVQDFKGVQDILVGRLKNDGTLLWLKTLGGSDGDAAYAIDQTPDGGLIIGGNTWST
ncbi:MAG: hypothetical protein JNJ57_06725, partial [Saprospiraceae bacterium]|nr:hypothetical protein [Saprospiraceae bacterium]